MSQFYFFDANAMLGRWPTEKLAFYRVDDLVKRMDYVGIKKALVYHSLAQFYDPMSGNRTLMEEIKGYDQLYGCWVLVPPFTSEIGTVDGIIAGMREDNVRAIRFFPKEHGFKLTPWNMGELLSALEEKSVPVFIDSDQVELGDIQRLCKAYPQLPVVLTRPGYRGVRMLYALLAQYQNFYLELSSFLLYRGVEEIVEKFGAEKILFGSGMPIQDPAGAVTKLRYAEIGEEAKGMIAHQNLERLLEQVGL
ncbi:MAG: amidohydrolase family protein [Candidatus Hydrothermae bacterium]|nr:amidohydrolase family protein [Candidatus Hydrothermae bacterium]